MNDPHEILLRISLGKQFHRAGCEAKRQQMTMIK